MPFFFRCNRIQVHFLLRPCQHGIASIAAKLADTIRNRNDRKVTVSDLRGPDQKSYPAGKWLGQQISAALQSHLPGVEFVDYAMYEKKIADLKNQKPQPGVVNNEREAARILGLDSTVDGSFAVYGKEIGITMQVHPVDSPASLGSVIGSLPVTAEILSLSAEPLPKFQDGIYKAGFAGISMPICVHCPDPEYSEQARKAKYEGIVVLEIVVSKKGEVLSLSPIKGPDNGLVETSQQTVRKWKFRPSVTWNGQPVDVKVPVEIAFRLLRNP